MKKVFCLIVVVLTLVSCEKYCPHCGEYGHSYCNNTNNSYRSSNNDYFCARTLLGIWQMDYNRTNGIELKQIEFFDGHRCDVTYQVGYDPDWLTDTFTYTYTGGYVKLNKDRTTLSFKVRGFLFPELYLQDSFGYYTWRKVKSYECL